jgi:type VI protein secretion system component VasF
MTPEFASLVHPTLHYVLDLSSRIKGSERVDLKSERYRIRNDLRHAEEGAARSAGAINPADFELARQVLIYWTDEILTIADQRWKEMTLEWEYYNSQDRAWKFYMDGESKARNSNGDVIELWYLAMVLGFEGDIFEGFRKLKRQDFPPVQASDEEARKLWAKELERQIPRRQSLADLPKPALKGNVLPLTGTSFLVISLQCFGALLLVFCILVAVKLSSGS